jgi:F-type H+-transporting ATPase subunit delta
VTIVTEEYRVALRYVTALLDFAQEAKSLDKIAKDLAELDSMLKMSEDLRNFTRSPLISRDDKIAAMQAIAKKAKFQTTTSNFLSLLAKNNRLFALETILGLAEKQIAEARGEVTAYVETAHVLSDKQTKELKESLKKGLGKDVSLSITEDANLLGGMIVRVGSLMVDDSVRTKVNRLQRTLRAGTTQFDNTTEEVA